MYEKYSRIVFGGRYWRHGRYSTLRSPKIGTRLKINSSGSIRIWGLITLHFSGPTGIQWELEPLEIFWGLEETFFPLKTFLLAGGQEPGWSLNQLKASLPIMWKLWLKDELENELTEVSYDKFSDLNVKGITRKVYDLFIADDTLILKYFRHWEQENVFFEIDEYLKAFQALHYWKIVKYQDFQYRLLLCKIVSNKELHEWGIIPQPTCAYCNEADSIVHMSHFAYACKMRYPLNLVLENIEYLHFY